MHCLERRNGLVDRVGRVARRRLEVCEVVAALHHARAQLLDLGQARAGARERRVQAALEPRRAARQLRCSGLERCRAAVGLRQAGLQALRPGRRGVQPAAQLRRSGLAALGAAGQSPCSRRGGRQAGLQAAHALADARQAVAEPGLVALGPLELGPDRLKRVPDLLQPLHPLCDRRDAEDAAHALVARDASLPLRQRLQPRRIGDAAVLRRDRDLVRGRPAAAE